MALHKIIFSVIILGGMILLSFAGCSKKNDSPNDSVPTIPVLTTAPVTMILTNAATCGGIVTSDGGTPVISRGICWKLTPVPQISDPHTVDGAGTGSFVSQMNNLIPDTVYFVRAYATNIKGTAYGNVQSFRTMKSVTYGVTDIDGNNYPVVKIGEQYWLRKNLRVTRYRTGDPIANVTADAQWKILVTGAFCRYDNLAVNDTIYGNFYNGYALADSRGICPTGWHVPTDLEWETLGDFLGGNNIAGEKLKSTGTIEESTGLWYAPNTNATNSSGFTGFPGGYRINYGTFYSRGNVGSFWSSSDSSSVIAWNFSLDANNGELKRNFNFKTNGFSVRCLKD